MIEIEITFKIKDTIIDLIKDNLKKLSKEHYTYYKDDNYYLLNKKKFRIRQVSKNDNKILNLITSKKDLENNKIIGVAQEMEFETNDFDNFKDFMLNFGAEFFYKKIKIGDAYVLDKGILAELSKVYTIKNIYIGTFLEIEKVTKDLGKKEYYIEKIHKITTQIGLNYNDITNTSYQHFILNKLNLKDEDK